MSHDCQIIPITEQHIVGFHAALDVVCRERKYLSFFEAPPIASTTEFVLDNIKNNYPHFVAIADNKVVGWCDINPRIDRPIFKHSGTLGIGITPEYRGKGLGKDLLNAAIQAALATGMTRIELQVRSPNENAYALYKKVGFVHEGTKRNAVLMDGIYENEHIMAYIP